MITRSPNLKIPPMHGSVSISVIRIGKDADMKRRVAIVTRLFSVKE
jgi:hypothetical protein